MQFRQKAGPAGVQSQNPSPEIRSLTLGTPNSKVLPQTQNLSFVKDMLGSGMTMGAKNFDSGLDYISSGPFECAARLFSIQAKKNSDVVFNCSFLADGLLSPLGLWTQL